MKLLTTGVLAVLITVCLDNVTAKKKGLNLDKPSKSRTSSESPEQDEDADGSSGSDEGPSSPDKSEVGPACNPVPKPNEHSHYIIGYGSLMNSACKELTLNGTGESIPVEVSGFCREWNLKGDGIGPGTTYLGVVPDPDSSVNGVVFLLPPSEDVAKSLKSYDERESFHCRRQVLPKDIKFLGQDASKGSKAAKKMKKIKKSHNTYWIYVNKKQFTANPSKEYPIVQSFVDVFLSGCLELEEKHSLTDFAKKCVTTTKSWNGNFWVNDRIYPRRPFLFQKKASKIDELLQTLIPKHFSNIRIEG